MLFGFAAGDCAVTDIFLRCSLGILDCRISGKKFLFTTAAKTAIIREWRIIVPRLLLK